MTSVNGLVLAELEAKLMGSLDSVSDELQSKIRMLFNEALAGGPNMNGDAGPQLSRNHALDCVWAAQRIESLLLQIEGLRTTLEGIVVCFETGDYFANIRDHVAKGRAAIEASQ